MLEGVYRNYRSFLLSHKMVEPMGSHQTSNGLVWRHRALTRGKLLTIMNDCTKKSLLMVEMAAVVDTGEPLVKAIYKLD